MVASTLLLYPIDRSVISKRPSSDGPSCSMRLSVVVIPYEIGPPLLDDVCFVVMLSTLIPLANRGSTSSRSY